MDALLQAALDRRKDSGKPTAVSAYQKGDYISAKDVAGEMADVPQPEICEHCNAELHFHGFVTSTRPLTVRWLKGHGQCNCPETERIRAEQKAAEERQAERERHMNCVNKLWQESGIRRRFTRRLFESFRVDTPQRKQAYDIAFDYAESFATAKESGEGLYIEGTYGTGKTHLAAAIAIHLIGKEHSVIMKTSFDLMEEIKRTFDDRHASEYEVLSAYRNCELLIIDDLGKEQCTDWSMSVLYSIVNERYENMLPTIITTNYGAQDLVRALTPRGYGPEKAEAIVSRLREVSKTLTMAWADCRGKL